MSSRWSLLTVSPFEEWELLSFSCYKLPSHVANSGRIVDSESLLLSVRWQRHLGCSLGYMGRLWRWRGGRLHASALRIAVRWAETAYALRAVIQYTSKSVYDVDYARRAVHVVVVDILFRIADQNGQVCPIL